MFKTLLAAAALAGFAFSAHADTLAQWSFQPPPADLLDSSISPSVAASVGAGTASGFHAAAATDWTTPAGNGSADSFSSNTWAVGDYWQFNVATTGFSNIVLSFDQTRSNTGPDAFKLAYSVNGGTSFTDFATYTVGAVTWSTTTPVTTSTFTFDLSGVSALNDKPQVLLQLVSTVTTAAGGTNRIDNVTVSGVVSAVPEAGTSAMLLAGLAAVAFVAARRKA
jgi:PEP-CTERM motif